MDKSMAAALAQKRQVIQKAWEVALGGMRQIDKIIRMGKAHAFLLPYTLVAVAPATKDAAGDETCNVFVARNTELDSERRGDPMVCGTAPTVGEQPKPPLATDSDLSV